MRKRRIGTAKFFTLLLLLYHTSANGSGLAQCPPPEWEPPFLPYTAQSDSQPPDTWHPPPFRLHASSDSHIVFSRCCTSLCSSAPA
ncbi:hypothetical protein DWZ40_04680 [Clostridium sp. AF32-12BH]|nr:hypothetical protein DWZ40_04680 [Clostridium sp. AF32-12BH]